MVLRKFLLETQIVKDNVKADLRRVNAEMDRILTGKQLVKLVHTPIARAVLRNSDRQHSKRIIVTQCFEIRRGSGPQLLQPHDGE